MKKLLFIPLVLLSLTGCGYEVGDLIDGKYKVLSGGDPVYQVEDTKTGCNYIAQGDSNFIPLIDSVTHKQIGCREIIKNVK